VAVSIGVSRYYTGKPCRWGHVTFRWVRGGCAECFRAYRAKSAHRVREYQKAYLAKNVDRVRDRERAYQANNADRIRERRKAYRDKNLGTHRLARGGSVKTLRKHVPPEQLQVLNEVLLLNRQIKETLTERKT
jgi:hypothetical protein